MSDPSVAPSARPPQFSHRYRIERLLGRGGMGAVYAALDIASGQRVALKRLTRTGLARAVMLFEREYHTLATLRHPRIVEAYEYGSDHEGPYYTMELLEGRDLSASAPMAWREVCACLRDVASILGVLHARGLVHRDLSPKNLLRTSDGRLKMIDFGALCPFGVATELAGTPPLIAPEALSGAPFDGRTDLFALGALGYWLLTGVHAFPGQRVSDLPELHRRTPARAASLLQLVEGGGEPLPPELDALIAALLRIDPAERPANTGELIDRLSALAELEPEAHEIAARGYLGSKALVGRSSERELASALLTEARSGRTRALWIEGEPGIGRTRLLQELLLHTRIGGAASVFVDASAGGRPYGVAEAIACALLDAHGEEALRAAEPYAGMLAGISETLRARVGVLPQRIASHAADERRVRQQLALLGFVTTFAKQRPVALLVDDAHAIDEESQALLAAAAHGTSEAKLFIVASACPREQAEVSAALLSFRSVATRLHLLPLTSAETFSLLRSVFGDAPYLERLSERLHRVSQGNPEHCLALVEHLVSAGHARYADGFWTLPRELTLEELPNSRRAGQEQLLAELSEDARALARLLSIPHYGAFKLSHCVVLSQRGYDRTVTLLNELSACKLLREPAYEARFTQESTRALLHAELDPEQERRAHLRLGEALLEEAEREGFAQLRAGVHFLRGGDLTRGYPLLRDATAGDPTSIIGMIAVAAPMYEDAYALLRERGVERRLLAPALCMLAVAGFFVNRRYALRYGDEALEVTGELLRVPLALRLRRFLGKRLALMVALIAAALAFRRERPLAPKLGQAISLYISASSALAGAASVVLDPESVTRFARALEPFAALGKDSAPAVIHQFALVLATQNRDLPALAQKRALELLARLCHKTPIRGLREPLRKSYIAGVIQCLGINATFKDGPDALQWADRLEQFGPLWAAAADHMRASYYVGQGDVARAETYRKRVEVQAVQLGSAWQSETWSPADTARVALRTNDALAMKRAVQELSRLSPEVPSLALDERRARGTYLVLRGKYAQAIPLLDTGEEPLALFGWTRTRATLARAYNGLGDHVRAREICLDALARITEADLSFTVVNLGISTELALAEASLGAFASAEQRIERLLLENGSHNGPLTMGALHEARARVALLKGDLETAKRQLQRMSHYYRPTGIPTLLELIETLASQLLRAGRPSLAQEEFVTPRLRDDAEHLLTRVQVVLARGRADLLPERARTALQISLELTNADQGLVLLPVAGPPLAALGGEQPSDTLIRWAARRIERCDVDPQTVLTEQLAEAELEDDENELAESGIRHLFVPLWAQVAGVETLIAALVLGFRHDLPHPPEAAVLRALAQHLAAS